MLNSINLLLAVAAAVAGALAVPLAPQSKAAKVSTDKHPSHSGNSGRDAYPVQIPKPVIIGNKGPKDISGDRSYQ